MKLCSAYKTLTILSDSYLSPVVNLGIRLLMAKIFFTSGWLRLQDYLNGQWANQITAFSEYHPIPGVPGEYAAILGTFGEIVLPVLLVLGLMTRFSAAGLLIMTLVIQFVVPEDYGVSNPDHYMWMLLLCVPFIQGGGKLSLDFLFTRFGCKTFCKKQA